MALDVPPGLDQVFEAIAWFDPLAYCVARLNLALDPAEMPAIGERDAAYETYLRVWQPERPSAARWFEAYERALSAATSSPGST